MTQNNKFSFYAFIMNTKVILYLYVGLVFSGTTNVTTDKLDMSSRNFTCLYFDRISR